MNLYSVGTPFQLISALEAKYHFQADTNVLLVRDSGRTRSHHHAQLAKLIAMTHWDEIIHWPLQDGTGITNLLQQRYFVQRLKRRFKGTVEILFIAGFRQSRNHYLRNAVQPQRTVLLDDGASTLKHFQDYISKNIFYPEFIAKDGRRISISRLVNRLAFSIDDHVLSRPVDLFTSFAVERHPGMAANVINHQFEHLKLQKREDEIDISSVAYLGSPFFERGYLDLKDELLFLRAALKHYEKQRLNFTYIAHRDECEQKLLRIKSQGIDICRLTMPVEIHFATDPYTPGLVSSAISTGLHNVHQIFPHIKCELLVVPDGLFRDGKRSAVQMILDYHRVKNAYYKSGIQLIYDLVQVHANRVNTFGQNDTFVAYKQINSQE